jgi:hypothetical protein
MMKLLEYKNMTMMLKGVKRGDVIHPPNQVHHQGNHPYAEDSEESDEKCHQGHGSLCTNTFTRRQYTPAAAVSY